MIEAQCMNISIERTNVEDAKELINIQKKCFEEDAIKYEECPSFNEDTNDFVMMIKNTIFYKTIYGNKIIGDISVRNKGEGKYYLRTICVLPEYQNMGIGHNAIEYIEMDNPGGRIWTLVTLKDNYRNCHFYEKMGYIKVGERKRSDILILVEYRKVI